MEKKEQSKALVKYVETLKKKKELSPAEKVFIEFNDFNLQLFYFNINTEELEKKYGKIEPVENLKKVEKALDDKVKSLKERAEKSND